MRQGGFTGTVHSDDGDAVTLVDTEVEAIKDNIVTVCFVQVGDRDDFELAGGGAGNGKDFLFVADR